MISFGFLSSSGDQPLAVFRGPVVGCELNARTCKHDVTRFIGFVPVWLFHFVCGSLTDTVHSESMYSGPTLSYVNRMK